MGLPQAWYDGARWPLFLLPLSAIYAVVVMLRRLAYRVGLLRQHRMDMPVIVVGNISVGGSGKTPLVAWLVEHLREQGWNPGVVSRGYGGKSIDWPQQVTPLGDPVLVGDEPVMLAMSIGCPVAVAPRRCDAAQSLRAHGVDIIVADDGLQHYALARDIEIAVRDKARGYGNGWLLPAGPLREPMRRLRSVDIEVVHGHEADFHLELQNFSPVAGEDGPQPLSSLAGKTVHALAGIGHPQRFFDALAAQGIRVIPHPLPDHHAFVAADIEFEDDYPVLMTAKDAVKCRTYVTSRHWYVPVVARVNADTVRRLDSLISALPGPAA